uniref:Uncharacterized protein n=1 Tax=Caenorhabditis tropicalis TaxID=1561998 RepID=A0A1I7UYI9_9PELO
MTINQPPAPSSIFVQKFCKFLDKEIIVVRQKSGNYLKFQFDHSKDQFISVECPDCYPITKEKDLVPLYPCWSNILGRHVIFANNLLNKRIEQYIYDKEYKGFQQVHQTGLKFNRQRSRTSSEFFQVGESIKEGVIRIRRDSEGRLKKERLDWATQQWTSIPAVPVKTLNAVEKEKSKRQRSQSILREEKTDRKRKPKPMKAVSEERINERKCTNTSNDSWKPELPDIETIPEEKPIDAENEWKTEVEIVNNKSKLSKKDVFEIRRLAAMMGNPTEEDSSDDADFSGSDDYDDVPDEMFDVVESSC